MVALNEALEKIEKVDPAKAQVVKLRYFAGLTVAQAAEVLGVSASTVDNYWAYARAWLRIELSAEGTNPGCHAARWQAGAEGDRLRPWSWLRWSRASWPPLGRQWSPGARPTE